MSVIVSFPWSDPRTNKKGLASSIKVDAVVIPKWLLQLPCTATVEIPG
jgi:hypothetical protein